MNPPIVYIRGFVPEPDAAFWELKTIDWERRSDAPRCEYYCNDYDRPYIYGKGNGRRTYHPKPWPEEVMVIRRKLEAEAGAAFEVCFLNMYLNQKDHLGWHADDSPEMDDARPIASVSLGVEREIWFRPKGSRGVEPVKQLLENGSLCLMMPGMQDTWEHRIPKASFTCGERISLTFRGYLATVESASI